MDLVKCQLNWVERNFGLKSYLRFQIQLALCARLILKSRVWFHTKLHSTQFNYHYGEEKIKFASTSRHVIFCVLYMYKHTNDNIFDDFSKISEHFPKISEDFPKLLWTSDEHFRTFSEDCQRFPKINEGFQGRTDDVSIIQQHIWVLSKRLCSLSNGDHVIFMCENNVWRYHVYTRKLTWYFPGVYIIHCIIISLRYFTCCDWSIQQAILYCKAR